MIRTLVYLALLAIAALALALVADQPGVVTVTWPWWPSWGRTMEMSPLAAVGLGLLAFAALYIIVGALRFVLRIPTLMSIVARGRRREKAHDAITRGMIAAGAGDVRAAERAARQAGRLAAREPLAMLLQAQAAQLAGDRDGADKAFRAMADDPRTKALGLRGLHMEARRRGDEEAAYAYAQEAHTLAPLGWAGQAMLEHHALSDDWTGALAVVEANIARKAIDKKTGERQRAVLKTAIARSIAGREPDEALRLAREAIKLSPSLIPAYALAGELLGRRNDVRRGARVLEAGWRMTPHPDLARAYVDLRPGDSAADRLARARALARIAPDHPESRLTLARAALEARDFALARQTMAPLIESPASHPTVRACLLMADIEETENGPTGAMRGWLARAARAPRDPMWIADGFASDVWAPASPVTGRLDAFEWRTPAERLSAPEPLTPDEPHEESDVAPAPPPLPPRIAPHENQPAPAADDARAAQAAQEAEQAMDDEADKTPALQTAPPAQISTPIASDAPQAIRDAPQADRIVDTHVAAASVKPAGATTSGPSAQTAPKPPEPPRPLIPLTQPDDPGPH